MSGEKALAVFLRYYYDLDWIREFIIRNAVIEKITHSDRLLSAVKLQVDNCVTARFLKLVSNWIRRISSREKDAQSEKELKKEIQHYKLLFYVEDLAKEALNSGHKNQAKCWHLLARSLASRSCSYDSMNLPIRLPLEGITYFLQAKVEESRDKESVKKQKFWTETLQMWQEKQFYWLEQTVVKDHIVLMQQEIEEKERITNTIDWMKFGERKASQASEKGDSVLRSRWLKVSTRLERLVKGKGYKWENELLQGLVCQERGERTVFGRLWQAVAEKLSEKSEVSIRYHMDPDPRKDEDDNDSDDTVQQEKKTREYYSGSRYLHPVPLLMVCLTNVESKLKSLKFVPLSNPSYDTRNKVAPRNTAFTRIYSKVKKLFAETFQEMVVHIVFGNGRRYYRLDVTTESFEVIYNAIEMHCKMGVEKLIEEIWEEYQKHIPKNDPSQWLAELDQYYQSQGRDSNLLPLFEARLNDYYGHWKNYNERYKQRVVLNNFYDLGPELQLSESIQSHEKFATECLMLTESLQKAEKLKEIPALAEREALLLDYSWNMMHRLVSAYPKALTRKCRERDVEQVAGLLFNRLLATVLTEALYKKKKRKKEKEKDAVIQLLQRRPIAEVASEGPSLPLRAWIAAAKSVYYPQLESDLRWKWSWSGYPKTNCAEAFPEFLACIDLADQNPTLAELYFKCGESRVNKAQPLTAAYQKAITCYEQSDMKAYELQTVFIQLVKFLEEHCYSLSSPYRPQYTLLQDLKDIFETKGDASKEEWMTIVKFALEMASTVEKSDPRPPENIQLWQRVVDYCKAHQG